MMSRFLLTLMLVLPTMAAAEETKLETALRQMLQAKGVALPLVVAVADRQVRGTPELLVTNVRLAGRSVLLSLRCRIRTQCGDVIATARFSDRDRAVDAYERLTVKGQMAKKAIPVIHAGERVRLVIQTQTVRLELPARALNSGAIAQPIRVRDPKTRNIYNAIVVGAKEVRVTI
jgi:hypothetical protein